MQKIFTKGRVTVWAVLEDYGMDYHVYNGVTLVRTCPSLGMAMEVAAGA